VVWGVGGGGVGGVVGWGVGVCGWGGGGGGEMKWMFMHQRTHIQ